MKFIKYYLIVAISGLMVTSCSEDFLSPLPDTVVTVEQFFQTDEDVLAGIIGIYDALQGTSENVETNIGRANRGVQFEHLLTEHRTDNTRNATLEGSKSDFHRYVVDANNVESEDYYQSMYEVIFRANNILSYMNVANEANRAKYTAEAKFLRAYAYFKLVRLYSDVPLVTSVVGPTETNLLFTRVPAVQVYAQIEEDLLEAIDVLDNSFKSRASKAAAQGILAKVYLTQPNRNYTGAQTLCESIISSGNFGLVSNFRDVFYSEMNQEIIFTIRYATGVPFDSQGYSAEFTSTFRNGRDDGQNIVNANLISDFQDYGGNRTAVSYITWPSNNRSEVTKFLPDGTDLTVTPAYYGPSPQQAGNDYIALRYADVLLMHVEAILAGGAQTNSSNAITSFQKVRNRAGLTDPVTNITKNDLLVERRVEFAFENQRWFDLIRFGVADAVLSAHAIQMGYVYTSRALLLPIPAREINLSGGLLTQNPGY